jgi:predicted nucleic acid-binding protein
MIILDTNIISEMMKPTPSPSVISWLDAQEVAYLYVTAITIAEISYGLNALPEGQRRASLQQAFNESILSAFENRLLPFEESAAYTYGALMAERKLKGKPLSIPDGQIAAISKIQKATLATRNTNDFIECGIVLINPFVP